MPIFFNTLEEKGQPKEGSGLSEDLERSFGWHNVLFGDPKKIRVQLNSIESIDLNPVLCSFKRCVVADARIMLKATKPFHEANAT
jgi:hypothetical protein